MQQHTPIAAPATRALARTPLIPLVLIVSLFFLWGVANNLNDVLVAQFKKAFTLSDLQAGLVQSAFYLGYFLLAIPAGIFMRRFGYKAAVVFGLLLYGAGALLFWPAAATATYATFLLGLFVIAAGLAFLETSANPWVTLLGPRESAASRLNLAQAFNPLGSITGVLIGQHFIFTGVERTPAELAGMDAMARTAYMKSEAAAVQMPYLAIGLGVIAWAVIIVATRFPRTAAEDDGSDAAERGVLGRLPRDGRFMSAVLAQFFYVGAQVAIFSYMIRYAQATMPGTADKTAANFITAGLLCFMAGRFAGAALMKYLRPARVLGTFALVNVALAATAAIVPGSVGIYALVASSFFMSIMYPTIFALGVEGRSDAERKLGASLLVMSIVGGAVITAAMGATSDRFGIAHAMLLPMSCFVAISLFAWRRSGGGEAVA
ncbi:L-fucose:H+ symporter permease [Luteibacter yeojuensis]|uniref:L-fucose:H+ symporter permease n=1 Tax=Luteibacter yeojuensis TaxID=345309 RepID=A0A7X5QR98_9GAMM|nr:L-fucose:H+ symporter permease [Luteibacter yeojuensis]NID13920.1 L-fucose:H+ symporter permease [Luteibacter yeojuensis]